MDEIPLSDEATGDKEKTVHQDDEEKEGRAPVLAA